MAAGPDLDEDGNGIGSVRGLSEIHGAFDMAGDLIEGDKLTVVSVPFACRV